MHRHEKRVQKIRPNFQHPIITQGGRKIESGLSIASRTLREELSQFLNRPGDHLDGKIDLILRIKPPQAET